jgi:hypothetical protein
MTTRLFSFMRSMYSSRTYGAHLPMGKERRVANDGLSVEMSVDFSPALEHTVTPPTRLERPWIWLTGS